MAAFHKQTLVFCPCQLPGRGKIKNSLSKLPSSFILLTQKIKGNKTVKVETRNMKVKAQESLALQ